MPTNTHITVRMKPPCPDCIIAPRQMRGGLALVKGSDLYDPDTRGWTIVHVPTGLRVTSGRATVSVFRQALTDLLALGDWERPDVAQTLTPAQIDRVRDIHSACHMDRRPGTRRSRRQRR